MYEIPAADFFRRQVHGARNLIHVPFHRENSLRRAEASKCAVRRGIRGHGSRMHAQVGNEVGTRRVDRAAGEHHRRKRRIRAAINHEINFHRHDFPVTRDAGAMPCARRVAFGGGHHVFRAVVNRFSTRLPDFRASSAALLPWTIEGYSSLAPESSAGFRLNHANFFRGQAEQRNERLVDVVRALQRSPDRHALRGICGGDHALNFDVQLLLRPGAIFALDDEVRPRHGGVHLARFHVV